MNDNSFDNRNDHLALSPELLQLMEWLLEHHADDVKDLIKKAFAKGLSQEMRGLDELGSIESQNLQAHVINFFSMLEILLIEVLNEQEGTSHSRAQYLRAAGRVDHAGCDEDTIDCSVEETSLKLMNHPEKSAQQTFYETLLQNWKPGKKTSIN